MMVVYDYGHVIQIDMCIPITVNVWTVCYIILGCDVVIEIGFESSGCRLLVGKDLEWKSDFNTVLVVLWIRLSHAEI